MQEISPETLQENCQMVQSVAYMARAILETNDAELHRGLDTAEMWFDTLFEELFTRQVVVEAGDVEEGWIVQSPEESEWAWQIVDRWFTRPEYAWAWWYGMEIDLADPHPAVYVCRVEPLEERPPVRELLVGTVPAEGESLEDWLQRRRDELEQTAQEMGVELRR